MTNTKLELFTPPPEWLDGDEEVDLSQATKYDDQTELLRKGDTVAPRSRAIRRRINWLSRQESGTPTEPRSRRRRNKPDIPEEESGDGIPVTWYPQVVSPALNEVTGGQGQGGQSRFMDEKELQQRLPFDPVDRLGQNFLVDPKIAQAFVDLTIPGADVVEVGSGPANMTPGIAARANQVIGLEIYPEYREIQEENLTGYPNAKIIIGDALRFDFVRWANADPETPKQVMGNIPFHISEPLLSVLGRISHRLERVTLLVGENLKEIIEASNNPQSERYSRLSFIASLFDIEANIVVNKDAFWPVPPVNGGLVSLSPREFDPNGRTTALEIRRMLVKHPDLSVAKVINSIARRAQSSKTLDSVAANRYDRRQTRLQLNRITAGRVAPGQENNTELSRHGNSVLRRVALPEDILNTPFQRLTNQQVQTLAIALDLIK